MELFKDYLASRVIADGKKLDDYTRIYFRTNEDLVSIYQDIDFSDKDVLSVLASSDQVFTARYLGARKVDSFDKNTLVLYYYYLRKWTIEYKGELYPNGILDNDYRWLAGLLSMVKPTTGEEKQALSFWLEHLKNRTNLSNLFFDDTREGKVLFSAVDLGKSISDDMQFKSINLFEGNGEKDNYDIIILSNIIEWARGNSGRIICIRDNLDKLLRANGIVLCTGLINRYSEKVEEEREIFDTSFDFIDYGKSGYIYQKK